MPLYSLRKSDYSDYVSGPAPGNMHYCWEIGYVHGYYNTAIMDPQVFALGKGPSLGIPRAQNSRFQLHDGPKVNDSGTPAQCHLLCVREPLWIKYVAQNLVPLLRSSGRLLHFPGFRYAPPWATFLSPLRGSVFRGAGIAEK